MYFYVYEHVLVNMYTYYMHAWLPTKARRVCRIPKNQSYGGLYNIMGPGNRTWVLCKGNNVLNCLIISPFPKLFKCLFFFLFSLMTQGLTLRVRLASKTCSCLPFLDFHVLVLQVLVMALFLNKNSGSRQLSRILTYVCPWKVCSVCQGYMVPTQKFYYIKYSCFKL